MYCKHCGKEIDKDSAFCTFCGKKVDSVSLGESNNSMNNTITANKSAIIANEIVGNLKMIGLAMIIVVVYMICFMLIHHKDIAKYDYATKTSYYGESCYDPSTLSGNWKLHWEQHYYELLYFNIHKTVPTYVSGVPTPEECLKEARLLVKEYETKKQMNSLLQKKQPKQEGVATTLDMDSVLLEMNSPVNLKKEAIVRTQRDIQNWNDTINNYRKWGYENDLKKNAFYSTLLCVILFILGRYCVKLVRWTNNHRST